MFAAISNFMSNPQEESTCTTFDGQMQPDKCAPVASDPHSDDCDEDTSTPSTSQASQDKNCKSSSEPETEPSDDAQPEEESPRMTGQQPAAAPSEFKLTEAALSGQDATHGGGYLCGKQVGLAVGAFRFKEQQQQPESQSVQESGLSVGQFSFQESGDKEWIRKALDAPEFKPSAAVVIDVFPEPAPVHDVFPEPPPGLEARAIKEHGLGAPPGLGLIMEEPELEDMVEDRGEAPAFVPLPSWVSSPQSSMSEGAMSMPSPAYVTGASRDWACPDMTAGLYQQMSFQKQPRQSGSGHRGRRKSLITMAQQAQARQQQEYQRRLETVSAVAVAHAQISAAAAAENPMFSGWNAHTLLSDTYTEPTAKIAPKTPKTNAPKFCVYCGGACKPNFKFCTFCAAPIPTMTA